MNNIGLNHNNKKSSYTLNDKPKDPEVNTDGKKSALSNLKIMDSNNDQKSKKQEDSDGIADEVGDDFFDPEADAY